MKLEKHYYYEIFIIVVLFFLTIGIYIGKAIPDKGIENESYDLGYEDGYDYAVHSAQLEEVKDERYFITYGHNDTHEYVK